MTSAATTTEATASSRRWVLLGALCGVLCLVLPLTLGGWPGGQAQLVPPTRPGSSTSSTIDDTLGEHFKPMPASTVKAQYAPDSAKDSSFRIDKEQLSVVVNRSSTPPEIVKVAALNADGKFDLPPEIQRVVFEIGTNDEPESIPVLQLNRDVAVIAFEPRPEAYAAMTSQFPKRLRSRLVAVPAAVAPGSGPKGSYTNMNVGGHKGCSSLLNMNQRLRRFASHEKKHAKRKAQAIQLRTVEWCTMSESVLEIPVVSLAAMVRFVPDSVQIPYVMTDAQGFDTMVISTLPTSFAKRVAFIVLECQDLPPQDHTLMLVDGALTCAEQQLCVESWFPHRLEYCWFNAYKVRELNCLYRNAGAPSEISAAPPRGLKISGAPLNISYPPRQASKWSCPVREEG